jgi:hypothetical protein
MSEKGIGRELGKKWNQGIKRIRERKRLREREIRKRERISGKVILRSVVHKRTHNCLRDFVMS